MAIRMATVSDVPQILAIYAPYVENTAISFEYAVPTQTDFEKRFLSVTARFPWLVWEEQGKILGYAYGSLPFQRAAYQWCCEASIYLHPEAHRQGIGKKLYTRLEQLLRQQGYQKVYAIVTTANEGSVAFHKAMGYKLTATMPDCGYKFGKWHGTFWLEKALADSDGPEKPPVTVHELP